jgi:hypothetical protein
MLHNKYVQWGTHNCSQSHSGYWSSHYLSHSCSVSTELLKSFPGTIHFFLSLDLQCVYFLLYFILYIYKLEIELKFFFCLSAVVESPAIYFRSHMTQMKLYNIKINLFMIESKKMGMCQLVTVFSFLFL